MIAAGPPMNTATPHINLTISERWLAGVVSAITNPMTAIRQELPRCGPALPPTAHLSRSTYSAFLPPEMADDDSHTISVLAVGQRADIYRPVDPSDESAGTASSRSFEQRSHALRYGERGTKLEPEP